MKTLIIAEAGVNHNGNLDTAKALISAAAEIGADMIKFQTFKTESIVSRSAKMADYQFNQSDGKDDSQFNMLKKLELPEQWHYTLKSFSEKKGIEFLSTGFDEHSIDFLEKLGISLFKIPSGEITNKPYLVHISKKGKPVILSTGMATFKEVVDAIGVLITNGICKEKITVLHCNTEYPTPMDDVNLLAMQTMQKELGVRVGYSDHTQGIEVSIAAIALGAVVIEKHFTLDRNMPGPDHKSSLEPKEFKSMVSAIRNIERAMGNGVKEPSKSERKNIVAARKSIVAAKSIKKGEIFNIDNLAVKRPGTGLCPMQWDEIIGKRAIKDFDEDEIILI